MDQVFAAIESIINKIYDLIAGIFAIFESNSEAAE